MGPCVITVKQPGSYEAAAYEHGMESGFLVVRKYENLYREYAGKNRKCICAYAWPNPEIPVEAAKRYCGIDREPLSCFDEDFVKENAELSCIDNMVEDYLFHRPEAMALLGLIKGNRGDYEIIWARMAGSADSQPAGFVSLGFEPTFFFGDHFSPVCDSMFLCRWGGADREGEALLPFFTSLNEYGLFDTAVQAESFLKRYLAFDWAETGEFYIAEIFRER